MEGEKMTGVEEEKDAVHEDLCSSDYRELG
jgi:hypothetical protein